MKPLGMEIAGRAGRTVLASGRLSELDALRRGRSMVIVTDGRVRELYGHLFPPVPLCEIGRGEKSKTLRTVESIYGFFLDHGVDRSWLVAGIGGGIVCDVTGFAASTYLRGLAFGLVPTTLLAQVDAATGGKNGVNVRGYKNQVGTFRHPDFVLFDPGVLKSLPGKERRNGFAEAIKHGVLGDENLFSFLEERAEEVLSLDLKAIDRVIHDSLRLKAGIVNRDETEKGERRKLNLGHTVGHALEKVCGIRHGEAVSIGMAFAARLSCRMGLLSPTESRRIESLLIRFGLPVTVTADIRALRDAMVKDKKRRAGEIHFVLPDRIGHVRIDPMSVDDLEEAFHDLCQPC